MFDGSVEHGISWINVMTFLSSVSLNRIKKHTVLHFA